MRRRVYLLRHAEVAYFLPGGKIAKPESVPLTPRGREQAEAARAALASEKIDRVMTSGLPRTLETAEIVAAGRGLAIEKNSGFEEIRGGKIRDIPKDAVEQVFAGAMSVADPQNTRFLGGESFADLEARVIPAWRQLIEEPRWEHLLLVAHGAVNRVLIAHALGADARVYAQIEQDPACINVIDVPHPGASGLRARTVVRAVNLTPYNLVKTGVYETTMENLLRSFLKNQAESTS